MRQVEAFLGVVLGLGCGCGRVGFDNAFALRHDAADSALADVPLDAQPAICHRGTWGPPTLILSTQTGSEEADPAISPDEKTLYFESNRVPSNARAIWVTTRADTSTDFGTPTLVAEADDASDDLDPTISSDGLVLMFTSLRGTMPEIFQMSRASTADPFSGTQLVGVFGDAVQHFAPKLSPDLLTLYYARDLEVAVARRTTTAASFTFERELDEVNVPATDGGPTFTPDELELFFDSYRDSAEGGIFTASRASTGDPFGPTTDLTATLLGTIAGGMGVGSPEITQDGRTLYYWMRVSNQVDLYTSTRSCD